MIEYDKNKDNAICAVQNGMINCCHGVDSMSQDNTELCHKVYREISEKLGMNAALTIHQMFKGTQVSFPQRFFDSQCVKERVIKEFDGTNIHALAIKYDYSEKSIRRMIKNSISGKKG